MASRTVTSHYDQAYYDQLLGEMLNDDAWYERRARCATRTYFHQLPQPLGAVLEYGCGIGQNIALLDDAVGFDVSADALAECERRGIATIDRADRIPRGRFDYVLCRHVLEHVERPLETIVELLSLLRPDGLLILVVPRETHRLASLEPDLHRHLFSWNFRCLNNLVHAAGGQPVSNRYEPSFGPRTDSVVRPATRRLGFPAYYHLGRLVGRTLGQYELVVHARPVAPSGSNSTSS